MAGSSSEIKLRSFSEGIEYLDSGETHSLSMQEVALIRGKMARLYLKTFTGGDYGQYLFYPSECVPLPVKDFFTNPNVSLEELYDLDLKQIPRPKKGRRKGHDLPVFWHDPNIVEDKFDRIIRDGQMVSLHNEDDEILGFVSGYPDTLEGGFESEEWENPIRLSGYRNELKTRKLPQFTRAITQTLSTTPNLSRFLPVAEQSDVYILHAFIITAEAQGKGMMYKIGSELSKLFSNQVKESRLCLFEVIRGSQASRVFLKAGAAYVPGALSKTENDGDNTLMAFDLNGFDYFAHKWNQANSLST